MMHLYQSVQAPGSPPLSRHSLLPHHCHGKKSAKRIHLVIQAKSQTEPVKVGYCKNISLLLLKVNISSTINYECVSYKVQEMKMQTFNCGSDSI